MRDLREIIERLTEADARTWHMRKEAHYNGGEVFFAYLHRCVEHPRLSRYDRYDRKTRSVTSTFRVDGVDRASLADAVDALNSPPSFDDREIALLRTFGDEPADRRKEMIADHHLWNGIKEKGAVSWENGRVRLAEAGRRALEQKP